MWNFVHHIKKKTDLRKTLVLIVILINVIFSAYSQDSNSEQNGEKQKKIVIIENKSESDIKYEQFSTLTENEFSMPLSYPVTKAIARKFEWATILFIPVLVPLIVVPLDYSIIIYDDTIYYGFLYHFYFPIIGAEHLVKLYTSFDVDLCPFKNLAAGVSADAGITIGRKVTKLNLGVTGGYFKNDWFCGYKISTSFGKEDGMKFSFMNGKTLTGSSIIKFDFGFKFTGF